jgi:hypothetical protein
MKNNIIETLSEWQVQSKVKHWVWIFIRTLREGKIDISDYREVEPDIDLFLNDIIIEIADFSWYQTREDVIENDFILDKQAKKALEVQSNISNNSEQVKNTISTKTETIEWVDISNEELAEKIWDLFYDSLSSFISSLWEKIDNKEISILLKEASENIMEAWRICLPHVSHNFPEMKHTTEIKWLNIDKEELAKRISNLVDDELKDFLEKLSAKIYKDWVADEWRKRIKLSNELYACAEKLKLASEKIK